MSKHLILMVFVAGLVWLQPTPAFGSGPTPEGKKLVVAVMTGPPWSMKDEDGNWTGITIDLWREIAENLHLAYDFKESDLEGVQLAVEHHQADLTATGLAITAEREARFDFSDPYFVFNQTVAVNSDQQPSLLQAFRSELFNRGMISIALVLVVVMFLGACLLWLLEQRGDSEHYSGRHKKAFFNSLFWSTMVLAGRDLPKSVGWSTHAPTTIPARLFGIVWMIAGVVIFSLFTASAASFLTARQMQSIVNSPDDLHHVKLGTVIGAAAEDYMKRHNLRYTIYETPVQLLDALVAHRIDAAVYGSTTLAYYAKTAAFNNKVTVLRFSLRHDFAAIPMPTGSPLRKPINKAILHVMETKKWQAIIDKYVSAD